MNLLPPKLPQILTLAVISLIITFVLFETLQSYAQGSTPVVGGSIAYGGALAGYVIVFTILFSAYFKISETESTDINIGGKWFLLMTKSDGSKRSGRANIEQSRRSVRIEVIGEVVSETSPPSTTFSSLVGVVRKRRIVFIYENSRREMGIVFGDIVDSQPEEFTTFYYDVLSTDTNNDPKGRLKFSRREVLLERR